MKMIQLYTISDGHAIPNKHIQVRDIVNVDTCEVRTCVTDGDKNNIEYDYYYVHYIEPYTEDFIRRAGVYTKNIIIGCDYYTIYENAPVIRKEDFEKIKL